MTKTPYDPAREGAQMAFDGRMSYGDYLSIDAILSAQKPLSGAHDELLFIIQHQTSELWMKLALHEIGAARAAIASGALPTAFKMLARVSRIMEQLNSAWDVLRTMTPADYTHFRDSLGQSELAMVAMGRPATLDEKTRATDHLLQAFDRIGVANIRR